MEPVRARGRAAPHGRHRRGCRPRCRPGCRDVRVHEAGSGDGRGRVSDGARRRRHLRTRVRTLRDFGRRDANRGPRLYVGTNLGGGGAGCRGCRGCRRREDRPVVLPRRFALVGSGAGPAAGARAGRRRRNGGPRQEPPGPKRRGLLLPPGRREEVPGAVFECKRVSRRGRALLRVF